MIHLVIDVDDDPTWEECTKEAVAELLTVLGKVTVVDCHHDKPKQLKMVDGEYRYE